MKKILLLFCVLVIFSTLWAEEQNLKYIANLSVSSGILSGLKIGLGTAK